MPSPSDRPPAAGRAETLAALRGRTGLALITATVLASGVASYDANVVKVAVPAIGQSLGASVTALQWTLTSYLIAVAALLLLAGALSDRFGRRRLVFIGLLTMAVFSVACAVAPSVGVLIAARAAQGIGAALVVPNSLALVNGTLRDSDRAWGIGIWAALETLGTTVGPYLGGWLLDNSSWRAVFLLNIPVILAALAGPRRGRPGRAGARRTPSARADAAAVAVRLAPVRRDNVMTLLFYGALSAASYLVIRQCELRPGYSPARAAAALISESLVLLVLSPISGFWSGASARAG